MKYFIKSTYLCVICCIICSCTATDNSCRPVDNRSIFSESPENRMLAKRFKNVGEEREEEMRDRAMGVGREHKKNSY